MEETSPTCEEIPPKRPSRPKSSLSDIFSNIIQACLLAIAVYGLFISDVGQRLFELLRGDIEKAEADLRELERQKNIADNDLLRQQEMLSSVRQDSLLARIDLVDREIRLDTANDQINSIKSGLALTETKLEQINAALSVARPALINQRCRALSSQLIAPVGLEMRYRILPHYRWNKFKKTARNDDFVDWQKLKSSYDNWADKRYSNDSFERDRFENLDRLISGEISDQIHWSQIKNPRDQDRFRVFIINDPRDFTPKVPNFSEITRNYEYFLIPQYEVNNKRDLIDEFLIKESLEEIDPVYADFKRKIRQRISPLLPNYSLYVDETLARQARTDNEIEAIAARQIKFEKNAAAAKNNLKEICEIQSPLDDLFFNLKS
ncbi:MAG: hypothetical protein ACXIT4_01370 [Erythrobacter sp.]